MANPKPYYGKNGKIISYRVRICLGRDEKNRQVFASKTFPRPEGLTPAREKKEIQRLADNWEKETCNEYSNNKDKKASKKKKSEKMTLVEFIDEKWYPDHVLNGNHTPNTIAFYLSMSKRIKEYLNKNRPDIRLASFDLEEVLDYLKYLRTEEKNQNGKPIGKTTIQHRYSTLKNILGYAKYIKYIKVNPCEEVRKNDRPTREDKEVDFLDSEEVREFTAALFSDKEKEYWGSPERLLWWQTLLYTLIFTGLRRGELVGLQWGDFKKKDRYLNIVRNVTIDSSAEKNDDPMSKIHIGELKGKRKRKAYLSGFLYDQLILLEQSQTKKYGSLEKESYIFCREENTLLPLYPTTPTRMMSDFVERHDLPSMSPHDIRHTSGSLLVEAGASLKEVQVHLGDRDSKTVQDFYVGIKEKVKKMSEERIENLLFPTKKENDKTQ